jgi:hypothetical protein
MRRIRSKLTYANVTVTVLAFIVLTGGTAVAVSGHGTQSSHKLAAGAWHRVGTASQPAFNKTHDCQWTNYDSVHSNAAFVRDSAGFVHLKGTVVAGDQSSSGSCRFDSNPTNQMIFILPPGYRPAKREAMAALRGFVSGSAAGDPAKIGTVAVDGPSIDLPAGAVSVDRSEIGGDVYFTLSGISFRCSPSGHKGCP